MSYLLQPKNRWLRIPAGVLLIGGGLAGFPAGPRRLDVADLVLAGDNAVVIGLAAAGPPADQRHRAIVVGILAATLLRIAFAGVAIQLLQVIGLLVAGGILLLWVCWKMWRELRLSHSLGPSELALSFSAFAAEDVRSSHGANCGRGCLYVSRQRARRWPVRHANIPSFLIFGLLFSVALMGIAADLLGRLLQKHRWMAYVGLAIILYFQ